jgi:hypothetical protein
MFWFNSPHKVSYLVHLPHQSNLSFLFLHTQVEFQFEILQDDSGHRNYIRKYFYIILYHNDQFYY